MKLVIGGAYQGKRAYAEEHDSIQKWANGETCPEEEIFSCEGMGRFSSIFAQAAAGRKGAVCKRTADSKAFAGKSPDCSCDK